QHQTHECRAHKVPARPVYSRTRSNTQVSFKLDTSTSLGRR
ncbi:hypothetical protein V3C99_012572, partial [Haemonchus contortus]